MSDHKQRDTYNQRTGRIGQRQVANLLDFRGWPASPLEPDLGEDLLVRIYKDGRSTGLLFHLQIKSTDELSRFRKANGDISYKFETKDLDHWNSSQIPMFILVWDTKEQEGHWLQITDDLIRDLDKKNPTWRVPEKVGLRLPKENALDEPGLTKIRQITQGHFEPTWKNRKPTFNLKIVAPPTPTGLKLRPQIKRFLEAGGELEVSGEFITITAPDWWDRLHDSNVFGKNGTFKFTQQPSKKNVPFTLKIFTPHGKLAGVVTVQLRAVRGGEKEVLYTNDHAPRPFHCHFLLRQESEGTYFSFTISLSPSKPTVQEARDAVPFLQALSNEGTLQIHRDYDTDDANSDHKPLEAPIKVGMFPLHDAGFVRMLDQLHRVETQTGKTLVLTDWDLSQDDIETLTQLNTIFDSGRFIKQMAGCKLTMEGPTQGTDVRQQIQNVIQAMTTKVPVTAGFLNPNRNIKLLGVTLDLGHSNTRIRGKVDPSQKASLNKLLASKKSIETLPLLMLDVEMIEEFLQWLPDGYESTIERLINDET